MECGMYSLRKVYVEANALSSIYIISSTIYMEQKYILHREYTFVISDLAIALICQAGKGSEHPLAICNIGT